MSERIHPKVKDRRIVRNKSSRNGVKPRLMVLHATVSHNKKGLSDLKAIGSWFDNPASQSSSHIGVDNEGNSARWVADADKAWTQAAYNSQSLSIEQILPGNGTEVTDAMYRETARWLARWAKKYNLRLRKARVVRGRVLLSGVIRHSELGSEGGNHNDPGPNYNLAKVLRYARKYKRELNRRS
jgi:hypothetical protein